MKEEILLLKHKKNSSNSSIPPSKDENRALRTRNLRETTGKKPGGQNGHQGKTLEMTDTPDEIVEIKPGYCQCCGEPLDDIIWQIEETRQVLDIPPIKTIFTEYQVFSKKCKCGYATIPDFPQGVKLNTPARFHQCCLSHLQRNVKYLNELYQGNKWGNDFLELLYESLELERNMDIPNYYGQNHERDKIIERFNQILFEPPDEKHKGLYTFYNRILRDRQHIFTFLFITEVPPDNNASERAIRNIKVKQKISGQFKIKKAAQNFAKIRSVMDTTIKNGLNVLEGLSLISKFGLYSN